MTPRRAVLAAVAAALALRVDAGASSTYAVIASTSRYWFNYRHTANALAVYDMGASGVVVGEPRYAARFGAL